MEHKLNEKKKNSISKTPHPIIIETEEKEIPDQKPPNEKILYFNLVEKKEKIESKDK